MPSRGSSTADQIVSALLALTWQYEVVDDQEGLADWLHLLLIKVLSHDWLDTLEPEILERSIRDEPLNALSPRLISCIKPLLGLFGNPTYFYYDDPHRSVEELCAQTLSTLEGKWSELGLCMSS
jgi:hypothetical protein